MLIFKTAGILLISLGILSGLLLFAFPFGIKIQGSAFTFWLLYVLCYVGGFILYALGSPDNSAEKILRTASGILIMIGLMSAIAIFLDKTGLIKTDGTVSLWLLFVICTISGTLGELIAEKVKGKTISEIKIP